MEQSTLQEFIVAIQSIPFGGLQWRFHYAILEKFFQKIPYITEASKESKREMLQEAFEYICKNLDCATFIKFETLLQGLGFELSSKRNGYGTQAFSEIENKIYYQLTDGFRSGYCTLQRLPQYLKIR